jgi:hypothetical protein
VRILQRDKTTAFSKAVVAEGDRFVIETDKGEFAISFDNGRLRISEASFYRLAVLPQTANVIDVQAVE